MARQKTRQGQPINQNLPALLPPDKNEFDIPWSGKWYFSVGQRILVEYINHLYKAVVLKRRVGLDGSPEYKIHYEKFRKSWDEWIDYRDSYPRTKANLKYMIEERKLYRTITARENAEKKRKAILAKYLKDQTVKNKRGRTLAKKPDNVPILNSQTACKRISSKSTNKSPKSANMNKNSVSPAQPTSKKRGRPFKRPSTSNVEETQPKRKKNKSTSTHDLSSFSIDFDRWKYLKERESLGKPDKTKNNKRKKNNLAKNVDNSIPGEPKLKKKRGQKNQVDDKKKSIDIKSIIESSKYCKVVLEPLDLSAYKHLKISTYKKTGQLSQNEPGNGLNTERSQSEMKIVSTSKNHFSDTGENSQLYRPSTSKAGMIKTIDEKKGGESTNISITCEISQLSGGYLPLIIPDVLCAKLLDDKVKTIRRKEVLQFSKVSNSIAIILQNYMNSKESADSKQEAFDLVLSILNYFNMMTFEKVLHPNEKKHCPKNKGLVKFLMHYKKYASQNLVFSDLLTPKKIWCYVFGPTHLLRLLRFIPPNVTDFVHSKKIETKFTIHHFQDFLSYLENNFKDFFTNDKYDTRYNLDLIEIFSEEKHDNNWYLQYFELF